MTVNNGRDTPHPLLTFWLCDAIAMAAVGNDLEAPVEFLCMPQEIPVLAICAAMQSFCSLEIEMQVVDLIVSRTI